MPRSGRCTAFTPQSIDDKVAREPKWPAHFLPYTHFTPFVLFTHPVSDLSFAYHPFMHCTTLSHPATLRYLCVNLSNCAPHNIPFRFFCQCFMFCFPYQPSYVLSSPLCSISSTFRPRFFPHSRTPLDDPLLLLFPHGLPILFPGAASFKTYLF